MNNREGSLSKRPKVLQAIPVNTNGARLNDTKVFVIPVGHSMSLKMQAVMHEKAKNAGVVIVEKFREADVLVAVNDAPPVGVKSFLGNGALNKPMVDLTWLRAVITSKAWIDPLDPRWAWGKQAFGPAVPTQNMSVSKPSTIATVGSAVQASHDEIENWVPPEFPTEFRQGAIALLQLIQSDCGRASILNKRNG